MEWSVTDIFDCNYACAHCDNVVFKIEPRGMHSGGLVVGRLPQEDDPLLCDKCNGVSVFKDEGGEGLVLVKCITDFLPDCTQEGIRVAQIRNAGLAILESLFGEPE